ncbi:MAG: 1-acyl-sn-glycerol-3-phosphate acyltransferase [Acidobacteriota bacterium]|nr:1-acyl-sn-glycerol-3-phosphate acyltransferase [Acidobacteriota bacterium]
MSQTELEQTPVAESLEAGNDAPLGGPLPEEIVVLSRMEQFAFYFTRRMNGGSWKRFWTFCQRTLGAGWIHLATYNIMRVYGLENVESATRKRPLLLVANHRSFFDMYAVSSVLFRRTRWPKRLFFPVRGRFFYDSPLGLIVNLVMGWWSMYPPIFATPEKKVFDKYSLRLLTNLCREGAGHIIGFHPEGHRNKNDDAYSFLRPQPGIGRIIKDADPQVIPVFVAGLSNNLLQQVLGNWRGGEPIRIHFGELINFSEHREKRDGVRTYKEITDHVMRKIAELGEQDRTLRALESTQNAGINSHTYRTDS